MIRINFLNFLENFLLVIFEHIFCFFDIFQVVEIQHPVKVNEFYILFGRILLKLFARAPNGEHHVDKLVKDIDFEQWGD